MTDSVHDADRGAVITGMGCVCAAGMSPGAALDSMLLGERHASSGTLFGPHALPNPFFAVNFQPLGEKRCFSALDTLLLAQRAAADALHQANLPESALARMAVLAGTTAGSALHFLHDYAASRPNPAVFPPPCDTLKEKFFSDMAHYMAANLALALLPPPKDYASETLPLSAHGPRLTVTNACTSGADALGLGLDLIRQGADCVLCGGADALSLVPHTGFARLMIYAEELCRPFDRARKGLNLGEGAAMLVLESPAHARKRGARVLGRVLGYGAAADAHHFTAPHPQGRGLLTAIHTALADARTELADIAFINAHATSTPDNDKVEGRALLGLSPRTPVWASKGCTGHTLGAAGALEAVFAVTALNRGLVPPSTGFSDVDPDIGLVPTITCLPLSTRRALSTSLGFGGGNAALVLEGEDV